jgi:CubicO group peptidase (beta-lactamase class C family)
MRTRIGCRHLFTVWILAAIAACGDGLGPAATPLPTSSAEAQFLDSALLEDLAVAATRGDYGEVHSLLIVRNQHIVLERYFRGHHRDRLHPVYSITKSVASSLIGLAWDRGGIHLDARLLDLFPQYPDIRNRDARKEAITLEHVLTMTAGFEWDEWNVPYLDPANPVVQLAQSSDWLRHVLDLPMAEEPGSVFVYNSGCSTLLSGVVERATGRHAESYAADRLFEPLGIRHWIWQTGPDELTATGWGLELRPRDMARLGLLFLDGGTFRDRRILSQAWVDRSTELHVGAFSGFGYGYQWWRLPSGYVGAGGERNGGVFFAWGWGDQFIIVLPAYEMVVVTTAGNYDAEGNPPMDFLRSHILPAIRDAERSPAAVTLVAQP